MSTSSFLLRAVGTQKQVSDEPIKPIAIYAIALLNSLIVAPLSTAVTEHFAMDFS